ncbi:hypothetical protein [Desulfallas thermosapovorans]|uniref:Uncharacterized protein n=1 Tax=Desulfallas thermosapovorans DSM 6562 TaxID=1121431 RepID=A0A5S4ZQY4_9FIRM|nr:hypothetical protein [Desulfallas thermosapovorans]TYO95322.1 hypothetical protein LX24_01672 [Desulfallas thermosapovorans DSM 6562]
MNDILFLLQGIPETIATTGLSLAFARIPLRWVPIAIGGAIISIIGSAIKLLPFALGLHTIAVLLMIVLFISKTTRTSPVKSFIVTISSILILILLELVIHLAISKLTHLNLQTAATDQLLWILIGLPQAIIVFILALLISKINKPVLNGWKI